MKLLRFAVLALALATLAVLAPPAFAQEDDRSLYAPGQLLEVDVMSPFFMRVVSHLPGDDGPREETGPVIPEPVVVPAGQNGSASNGFAAPITALTKANLVGGVLAVASGTSQPASRRDNLFAALRASQKELAP